MRVALVHDWLTGMRGGEKCLEIFCEALPAAPIYTLFHVPGSVSPAIESHPIHTSFLQRLPGIHRTYQRYLPLFRRAIESFDLSEYDLILSCSHCVAKSVIGGPGTQHLCYIFTPMRYIWDMMDRYFSGKKRVLKWVGYPLIAGLRRWDRRTADRVSQFVAISDFVAGRVKRTYDRDAHVVYPPVELDRFPLTPEMGEHYLMVAADAAYKRVDLAVEAFGRLGIPLHIVGKRQDENPLAKTAPPHVQFHGFVPDEELHRLYTSARGFLLPCFEEFGIANVEAMACGKPVVALQGGAALETVRGFLPGEEPPDNPTGVYFASEDADLLEASVRHLEENRGLFDPTRIREHAMQYDQRHFWPAIEAEIDQLMAQHV